MIALTIQTPGPDSTLSLLTKPAPRVAVITHGKRGIHTAIYHSGQVGEQGGPFVSINHALGWCQDRGLEMKK